MLAQRLKAPSQDKPSNSTPIGFIFVCTDKSEKYMLENLTFPQSKAYGHRVFAVRHKRSKKSYAKGYIHKKHTYNRLGTYSYRAGGGV
jgi:hypothetical protein